MTLARENWKARVGRTLKSEISSVRASLHASIRSALTSARSKDAMTPCWPTWTIVRAVCSKALKEVIIRFNLCVFKFCSPHELIYAFPDDSIAPLCRRDALQPVDNELTSPDESCATCLAGFHFGVSLMHQLHCSVGRTQGYTTHE